MQIETVITGTTRVYGIIGFPVAHSLSPVMQNAAMQSADIDGVYVPFAVPPSQLSVAVAGLRSLQLCGFNVTIPHKIAIMPFLDELTPGAVLAGAVNTVANQNGRLIGYNTDGDGLIISLQSDLDCTLSGLRVVLIGAGGAARGALAALCRAHVQSVAVINRTRVIAETLIDSFSSEFPGVALHAYAFEGYDTKLLSCVDLVVNATSLGMSGEKIEGLPLAHLPGHAKVYDMVYNPPVTPLQAEAQRLGLKVANGLGMLVAQGEQAFSLWHGVPSGAGVMRAALEPYLTR